MKDSVLHHKKAPINPDADASLNISHELFIDLLIGRAGISEILMSDELSKEGSEIDLIKLLSLLDKPTGTFNIVTP